MRVMLISPNTEQLVMPTLPLGLVSVATAAEKAGFEVRLLDLMGRVDARSAIRSELEDFRPRVIGISVRNIDDQAMKETKFLLEQAKEGVAYCREISPVPIVLGGPGYSIYPDAVLTYTGADMGIRGEGEASFPALLSRIAEEDELNGIPGLHLRDRGLQCERTFACDLDTLSLPDPRLWQSCNLDEQELWIPFQIKRGCPFKCSYCSTAAIEGETMRKRSPGAVVEGIARHVSEGFRRFYFTDNIFNLPPRYAAEVCRALAERDLGISWKCILYPARVEAGLAWTMARAGCSEVSLGFESGSERILRIMHKRYNPEEVRRTSRIIADAGIRQIGYLLLGGPGETRESIEESFAFAASVPLDMLKITIGIRIYPDTALAKRAVDEGMITPEDNLLFPRFYMVRGLEGWLYETARTWISERPQWFM